MSMGYSQAKNAARLKYGVSDVRPQDLDQDMLITSRRNNLGLPLKMPADYHSRLVSLSTNVEIPLDNLKPGPSPSPTLKWVDRQTETSEVYKQCQANQVVGVDFEFHNSDTFEGFICVTSLAVDKINFVVDCLFQNRQEAVDQIKCVLQDESILKVFCGADNDLIRVKKDWESYPVNVLDIQDLFVSWKILNFDDCFQTCISEIKNKILTEKYKKINDEEANEFLQNYDKPSLEFLTSVLIGIPCSKNKLARFADFRRRPLHPELILYSALDAQFTLDVYKILAKKVGSSGITMAIRMSIKKLTKVSSAPVFKSAKLFTNSKVGCVVQKWREYLAKNLDKNPSLLISNGNLEKLIDELIKRKSLWTDGEALARMLTTLKFDDNCEKAARLLIVFLDPEQVQMRAMEKVVCHRCNLEGHTAYFCYSSLTKTEERETKRDFRKRDENRDRNHNQFVRRWNNYCRKRNLDPEKAVKPWTLNEHRN